MFLTYAIYMRDYKGKIPQGNDILKIMLFHVIIANKIPILVYLEMIYMIYFK